MRFPALRLLEPKHTGCKLILYVLDGFLWLFFQLHARYITGTSPDANEMGYENKLDFNAIASLQLPM